jgi:hypothetical protein
MPKPPLVVLLGDSLLIEGVAFSLTNRPMMNVIQIDPALLQMRDCWKCLEPDLIVFELGAPWSEELLTLLNEQPHIQLAGLDPSNCRLVVMTSHQYRTQTMQELLQVVEDQTKEQNAFPEGG